jgi:outer membrane protein OmpA-like peptidoglycan-associated protein
MLIKDKILHGLAQIFLCIGLFAYQSQAQTFTRYQLPKGELGEIQSLAIDSEGMKWIGTPTGFYGFTGDSLPSAWRYYDNPHTSDTLLRNITAIAIDEKGHKWLASNHDGVSLIQLDKKGNYINKYDMPNMQNKDHTIRGIAIDKQGKKWLATKQSGVWVVDKNGKWFNYDITTVYEIPSNHIYSIAVDAHDVKWVGTDLGVVSTKDGSVWDLYDMNGVITAITTDKKDNVCLCMEKRNKTLVYCNNEVHRVKGKDEFTVVKDLLLDRKGTIWAAGNGLARYEAEDRLIYDKNNSNFVSRSATRLALDIDDMIWIGTIDDGLYKLDPKPIVPKPPVEVLMVKKEELKEVPKEVVKVEPKVEPLIEKVELLAVSFTKKMPIPLNLKKMDKPNLKKLPPPAPVRVNPLILLLKPAPKKYMEEEPAPQVAVIQGQEVRKGTSIQLKGILFKTNSDELISYEGVQQLLQFMLDNPTVEIELAGHTDRNPEPNNPDYQQICDQYLALSQRRVDAVTLFLTGGGVAPKRIATKAYGGSKPLVASQFSERNRRVEMRILKME